MKFASMFVLLIDVSRASQSRQVNSGIQRPTTETEKLNSAYSGQKTTGSVMSLLVFFSGCIMNRMCNNSWSVNKAVE